jgi:hypothetical protein
MPRRGRHHLSEVAELSRQLAYAPPHTRRRQMERIERLVGDIEPDGRYPLAFVVFRISGYRPDDDGPLLPGDALRQDLVELVRVLSEALDLSDTERGGGVPLPEAATSCGITERTLHRWRHEGLCVHRATCSDGSRRLVVFREVLNRFQHARRLERPRRAAPVRFGADERTTVLGSFDARRDRGQSATAAAEAISKELGRSREAIRRLLMRSGRWPSRPRTIGEAAFDGLVLRAFDLGIPPGEVAERHGRDPAAAAKRCRVLRRLRLRGLVLPQRTFPTFSLGDAADVIGSSPAANAGMSEAWWIDRPDAVGLIAATREDRRDDRALAEAESLLAVEAWLLAEAAPRLGLAAATERDLDAIETSLRWAALLRARVVRMLLPLVVERAEQTLGGPMTGRTGGEISRLLGSAFAELGRLLDAYEPSLRTGPARSLRGVATLALDRRFAALVETMPARRASARHETLPLADPSSAIAPWSRVVGLGRHLRRHRDRLDPEARRLVEERWGWGDGRPHRIDELLEIVGGTRPRLLGKLARAERLTRPLAGTLNRM